MLLKRFYINLIIRLTLILANMVLQAFAIRELIDRQMLFTFIVLSGILVLQVVLLFLYVKKTNRLLTRLVLSVSNRDFSQSLGKNSTPHKELNQALNKIIEQYQSVYMEKESQSFLLQHLLHAIPAGIMVLDQKGQQLVKNQTFEHLLKLEDGRPGFYELIVEPGIPGTYSYKLSSTGGQLNLSVTISELLLLNSSHRIILVQDISKEVDAGELDAIQRLLRILTHEIMNSLAPVQSLAETVTMLMNDAEGKPREQESLSQSNYNDILESVQAIHDRVSGMDHFVNRFRTLTRLPESLKTEAVEVTSLFTSVCKIMHAELARVQVQHELESDELVIRADAVLVEQVLINLLSNSLTAMTAQLSPRLILKAFRDNAHILMQVSDNGSGIPEDKLADIFLPFYSTKEQASGIGLSFVKQILKLHNASIHVQSNVGQGSTFTLSFPFA